MELKLNGKNKRLVCIFLICLLCGFLLLIPAVRQLIIGIAEKLLVRRKLNDYKWSSIIMWMAIGDIFISGYISAVYLFIDNITRKKILLLFFSLMFIWLIGVLYFSFSSASYVESIIKTDFNKETAINLYPQAVSMINGYEIIEDKYLATNYDPQIYILPPKQKVASTLIEFSEPISVDAYIEVYYAVNNYDLVENNSVKSPISKGSSEIILNLPSAIFTSLRYDINIFEETFGINGIYVSENETISHIIVWVGNKNVFLLISIICFVIILWSLWSFGIIPVWIDRFNQVIKNIQQELQKRDEEIKNVIDVLSLNAVLLGQSYEQAKIIEQKDKYNTEEFEKIEILTSRFAHTVDMLVNKTLWSIDSNRIDTVKSEDMDIIIDIINRAKERGIVQSAEELLTIYDLRNNITHEYQITETIKFFTDVLKNTPILLEIIKNINTHKGELC